MSDCTEELDPDALAASKRALAAGGLLIEHATCSVHTAEQRTADGLRAGRSYRHGKREVRFAGTRTRPPSKIDLLWAKRMGRAAEPVVESTYVVVDGLASTEGLDAHSAAQLFVRLARQP